ncbi:MAG: 2-dehydro-3-deoxygalactonokinase [Pseudomonadota bacterium]
MVAPAWIACDWGTSALRVWAMSADGQVLDHARSDKGMGTLDKSGFQPALLSLIEPWLTKPTRAVACGMVGARQGWVEAPYTPVPCDPRTVTATAALTTDPRLTVTVLGGIRQDQPADVMRGEETQIAGALTTRPDFDGVLCLPGTHTKWAQISAGEIVSFRTFMSGELFALMSTQSVLRHSLGDGWDAAAFTEAVSDTLSKPEALAARFFALRAESLLHDLAPDAARARLSGLLIGAELAAARPYWLGTDVLIVGSPAASQPYASALAAQGVSAECLDAEAMTLAGLAHAHATLGETA